MTSIQERLQRKREPLDKWSIREQLCLSFAVAKVGDQNWMSVSRSLKSFGEGRPADWFHQKNCAAQYGALLENIDTPKRKKRSSGVDALESPAELILKKLNQERLCELKALLLEEKAEYKRLQDDMTFLQSGNPTEEELDAMCKQIDEEEQQKENEALQHAQWLKEREARKAELERVWRPTVKIPGIIGAPKRKASDSIDQLLQDVEETQAKNVISDAAAKTGLSPLLTSLLKTPSPAQNVITSSILHSAITSPQRTTTTNPTIESLLNTSASDQVSPGIQQLVTSAIAQEPEQSSTHPIAALLDSADTLPDLQADDIEHTILSGGEALPEMKHEVHEVDVIISDLIESHSHIVTDPETHLLDSDDIISNLDNELKELDSKEKAAMEEQETSAQTVDVEPEKGDGATEMKVNVEVDPFEFQEDDPEVNVKLPRSNLVFLHSSASSENQSNDNVTNEDEQAEDVSEVPAIEKKEEMIGVQNIKEEAQCECRDDSTEAELVDESKNDNIDIVQNVAIVHIKEEPAEEEIVPDSIAPETTNTSIVKEESKLNDSDNGGVKEATPEVETPNRRDTFTPEYSEPSLFEENIQVTKMDKVGKVKRDYSRTKKREEPELDLLLAVNDDDAESGSEQGETKKADIDIKVEVEHSHSPWTESEEPEVLEPESDTRPQTRRYSTPATLIDSVPNSPASLLFEDDREYRSWKKSVMLVYSRIANHKYASLFLKPITNEQAPGYHTYIKRPIDLTTIKKNVEAGILRTTAEFKRDLMVMFQNAIMFNKTDDTVFKMTLDIQQEAVEQLRILLQAQSADNTSVPARRETRTSELAIGNKRKRDSESLQVHNKSKKRKEDF